MPSIDHYLIDPGYHAPPARTGPRHAATDRLNAGPRHATRTPSRTVAVVYGYIEALREGTAAALNIPTSTPATGIDFQRWIRRAQ